MLHWAKNKRQKMRNDVEKTFHQGDSRRKGKRAKFPRRLKKFVRMDPESEPGLPSGTNKAARVYSEYRYNNNQNWGFIHRLLMGNVGRPWNEVFSEICQQADGRSYEGYTVREAVLRQVETDCFIGEDNQIYDSRCHLIQRWRGEALYVHPETGTLEMIVTSRKKEEVPQRVYELDGILFHEHEGNWFRVQMQGYSYGRPTWCIEDSFKAHKESNGKLDWYNSEWNIINRFIKKYGLSPNGGTWYCIAKESANSKEIKKVKEKYGL